MKTQDGGGPYIGQALRNGKANGCLDPSNDTASDEPKAGLTL